MGEVTAAGNGSSAVLLRDRLDALRAQYPGAEPRMVADVVQAVLMTMRGDMTLHEAIVLGEVEELGRVIASAKREIAALRVDDINESHIPFATDELDAIVAHTATATDRILEVCETLDGVAAALSRDVGGAMGTDAASKLQVATTCIYEACSFQDITGQRITKVVAALKLIEAKVASIVATFGRDETDAGSNPHQSSTPTAMPAAASTESGLLNGPQLPALAMDQTDIDRLLASFD
jgi:chemotaxis protein CheZ